MYATERKGGQMTAREWLELVRLAASEIEPFQRELAGLMAAKRDCLPWQTKGSTLYASMGGTHSDPTASEAQARISELDAMVADVKSKLDERIRLVGECGELLMRLRREMGAVCKDVLEIYYIDRAGTWSEVAEELGISLRTVIRERDKAIEWMDVHGMWR
jgi:DNA invertase Pin-like site-specific DNA recombinase